jgi:hypothetical protein
MNDRPANPPNNREVVTDKKYKMRYDLENAPRQQKLIILCKGGVAHMGVVTGNAVRDQDIRGWSPMPSRDKDIERQLGLDI